MTDLWAMTVDALEKGDFSRLEAELGGPEGFDRQIVEWFGAGQFDDAPEALAEALSCACMLGRTATAGYLIDHGGWRSAFVIPGVISILIGIAYASLRWEEITQPKPKAKAKAKKAA